MPHQAFRARGLAAPHRQGLAQSRKPPALDEVSPLIAAGLVRFQLVAETVSIEE